MSRSVLKEGDRVVWTRPEDPAPLAGKIVCTNMREHGVVTLDLDNGRKAAALERDLKPVPAKKEFL